jgi:hypothetical protein
MEVTVRGQARPSRSGSYLARWGPTSRSGWPLEWPRLEPAAEQGIEEGRLRPDQLALCERVQAQEFHAG